MEKTIEEMKNLNARINLMMGLVMAFTSPIIHVNMIQAIDQDFYKIVTFVQEIIALLIFFYMDKRDKNDSPVNLKKIRLHFLPVVILGCCCFITANIFGLIDARVRFLILASVEAFFAFIWMTIMNDLFNCVVHGIALTAFDTKVKKYDRIGGNWRDFTSALQSWIRNRFIHSNDWLCHHGNKRL